MRLLTQNLEQILIYAHFQNKLNGESLYVKTNGMWCITL